MKKILVALFLVSSALAFSARVVKSTETVVKENIVYVGEEKVPYTGVVETYNARGVLEEKTEFKDGKKNGVSKKYYPNGKIKIEEPYKNGKLDGTAKAYDENGKIIHQATFKNGEEVK